MLYKFSAVMSAAALLMSSVANASIVNGRYSVNQVFDVQRSPAFPSAGNPFNLSNFKAPFRDNFTSYNIGTGYISFFLTGDANNLVGIRLFDASNNLLETVSAAGDIYGLEEDGFLYVSDTGGFGTFVSNNEGFSNGDATSYTPSQTGVISLADLLAYNASTTPLADGQVAVLSSGGSITLVGSVTTLSNLKSLSAARAMDGFISTTNDSALKAVFDGFTTDAERSELVDQSLPVTTAGTTKAVLNTMGTVSNIVQARNTTNSGLSTGDDMIGDNHVWFKPFYTNADQSDDNNISGYSSHGRGMVIGVDKLHEDLRLGLAFTYANTDVRTNDVEDHVSVNAYELLSYGSYGLNQTDEMNFQLGLGFNNNDATREITSGGLNRTAEASYDSMTFRAGVGVGRVHEVREDLKIATSARVDYNYIRNQSYEEVGAGALNLKVEAQDTQQVIPSAKVNVEYDVNDKLTTQAHLGAGYDVINDDATVTSSFVGGGASFRTDGITPTPWTIESGVSVAYDYNERTSLRLSYERQDRGSDFYAQSVSFNVKVQF